MRRWTRDRVARVSLCGEIMDHCIRAKHAPVIPVGADPKKVHPANSLEYKLCKHCSEIVSYLLSKKVN